MSTTHPVAKFFGFYGGQHRRHQAVIPFIVHACVVIAVFLKFAAIAALHIKAVHR